MNTLNDLHSQANFTFSGGNPNFYMPTNDYVFLESELRQEAIKQIKYLETEFITERPKDLADVYKNKAAYQIQWIKHFFNITDEDLK